jgi:hypothetical protein
MEKNIRKTNRKVYLEKFVEIYSDCQAHIILAKRPEAELLQQILIQKKLLMTFSNKETKITIKNST